MIQSNPLQFAGQKAILKQDTAIPVKVLKKVTAETHAVGDRVELQVTQDVFTPTGEKVIAAGAQAFGSVSEIVPPARRGKPGALRIRAERAKAVDGSNVILGGTKKGDGKDRTNDAHGIAVLLAPLTLGVGALALLMKGEVGEVLPDTRIEAYATADSTIEIPDPEPTPTTV